MCKSVRRTLRRTGFLSIKVEQSRRRVAASSRSALLPPDSRGRAPLRQQDRSRGRVSSASAPSSSTALTADRDGPARPITDRARASLRRSRGPLMPYPRARRAWGGRTARVTGSRRPVAALSRLRSSTAVSESKPSALNAPLGAHRLGGRRDPAPSRPGPHQLGQQLLRVRAAGPPAARPARRPRRRLPGCGWQPVSPRPAPVRASVAGLASAESRRVEPHRQAKRPVQRDARRRTGRDRVRC